MFYGFDNNKIMPELVAGVEKFLKEMTEITVPNFKAEVYEDEQTYVITAETPGVKKQNINIDYDRKNLIISVTKEKNQGTENEKLLQERSFYLEDSEEFGIQAKYEDGILKVLVPKLVESKNESKTKINID
jgi:HSP20 family protein